MRRLVETSVYVAVALLMVAAWLVEPYAVVSGSMHPTLLGPHREFNCANCDRRTVVPADEPPMADRRLRCSHCKNGGPLEEELGVVPGDALLVDRTVFTRRPPRRWEVIAFRLPGEATKIAVKRVAGLPGETVSVRGGRLFIDDVPAVGGPAGLDYSMPRGNHDPAQWRLGADEYFVVGDNPTVSDDSRTWTTGPGVAAQLIVGKPFIVHVPRRLVDVAGRRFHVPDIAAIRYIR
jgi:signal peptidase I